MGSTIIPRVYQQVLHRGAIDRSVRWRRGAPWGRSMPMPSTKQRTRARLVLQRNNLPRGGERGGGGQVIRETQTHTHMLRYQDTNLSVAQRTRRGGRLPQLHVTIPQETRKSPKCSQHVFEKKRMRDSWGSRQDAPTKGRITIVQQYWSLYSAC